jgi:hypothetical protein
MNRRLLLKMLVGSAVLDPERLLWVPGKKLISIPAVAPALNYSNIDRLFIEHIPRTLDYIFTEDAAFARLFEAEFKGGKSISPGVSIQERILRG